MPTVIVPNHLAALIYEKIDAQLALHPDLKDEREVIFSQLLEHFNLNGEVPDFTIQTVPTLKDLDLVAAKPTFNPTES